MRKTSVYTRIDLEMTIKSPKGSFTIAKKEFHKEYSLTIAIQRGLSDLSRERHK